MMNNNNKIDEIKKVRERIRAEKYSDVPASIVEKIVDVQVRIAPGKHSLGIKSHPHTYYKANG